MDKKEEIIAPCKGQLLQSLLSPTDACCCCVNAENSFFPFTASQLRRVYGQEPPAAGRVPGGAAEVGEQAGEEDPQEATAARALCTLLATRLHEGPTQPVHEEAQSTAPHQQEQVESRRGGVGLSTVCFLDREDKNRRGFYTVFDLFLFIYVELHH